MGSSRQNDEWLIQQVSRGERRHLDVLVRRYAGSLLTFLQRMTGDRHRAEEAFQDAFLQVWRKRKQYRVGRPFKPWLYKIALNCCRGQWRTAQRTAADVPLSEELLAAGDDPSPADVIVAKETATCVLAAVRQLPQQQRAVAVMRVYHDMSYAEIAEVLQRSEATARSLMHHALASLRKYLEPRLKG